MSGPVFEPAFPCSAEMMGICGGQGGQGISVRDYFAAKFLGGAANDVEARLDVAVAADQYDIDLALADHWSGVANAAYIAADAMLARRLVSETCSTNSDILLEALQRITTINMGRGALAFEAAQNIAQEAISKATGEAK